MTCPITWQHNLPSILYFNMWHPAGVNILLKFQSHRTQFHIRLTRNLYSKNSVDTTRLLKGWVATYLSVLSKPPSGRTQ
jgi:hypothetical protein